MVGRSRALSRAAGLAAAYVAVAATYIGLSGHIALRVAPDVDDLARIEALKGTAFVVATGFSLLLGAYWLLRRSERDAAELRRSREALLLAEQRALAGLLASSVAHDFGNLLVPLHAGLRELQDDLHPLLDDSKRAVLGEMKDAVDRLVELSRRQSSMGRGGAGRFSDVNLASVVKEAIQIARRHTNVRGASLSASGPDRYDVYANATLLQQVIMNLVLNAGEATDGHGHVEVRYGERDGDVYVEVFDDGPGLSAGERSFEPFFTTKQRGTGLGLFSVRACADLHGGDVEVVASPLGGAGVRVHFPKTRSARRDAAFV